MKILFTLILVIFCINIHALEREKISYGIYADYGINILNVDFGSLPGIPNCCNNFDKGNGYAFSLGGVGYYNFKNYVPKLKGGLRLTYYQSSNDFSIKEGETFSVDNQPYEGEFEHLLTTKIQYLNIYPVLEYNIYDKLNLNLGLDFRIPINSNYNQSEIISDPIDRGVFPDTRTNIRNEKDGEIPNLNPLASFISIGVNYELPLNNKRSLIAKPEIGFDYALNSNVDGITFYENRIKIGVEVLFNFIREPIVPPIPPMMNLPIPVFKKVVKPLEVKEPNLEFNFTSIDDNGDEEELLEIKFNERNNFTLKPMLTYVFFLEDSYKIRKEYRDLTPKEVSTFDIDSVKHLPTMDIYYNMMNVVAKRLTQRPQATITLIGCNSDENLELNDKKLSMNRAIAVRDYFINTWKIDSARITIETRNLPRLPSNVNHNDGIVENRRVEIHSSDWEIVKPIIDQEFFQEFEFPTLKISINDLNNTKNLKWNLKAKFEGNILYNGSGQDFIGTEFEIKLDKFDYFIIGYEELEFQIDFEDSKGNKFSRSGSLPFTIVDDKEDEFTYIEVAKYNLILFEFDKSRLTDANQKIVDIINSRIHPNSTGVAYAYTDRTGTEEHNLELSDRRAKSIINFIKIKDIDTEGKGESFLLYDNYFPEGRFYCRTTEIIVTTEITR
ncbi:OmpA family protein [Candidatus Kapabacteria bacterium]|nr:OmpA family protein [Candidatus Kapabacteria bacterium]